MAPEIRFPYPEIELISPTQELTGHIRYSLLVPTSRTSFQISEARKTKTIERNWQTTFDKNNLFVGVPTTYLTVLNIISIGKQSGENADGRGVEKEDADEEDLEEEGEDKEEEEEDEGGEE